MDSGVKPIDPAELLGRGSSRSLALDAPNAITLRHKTRGRDFSLPLPGPDRHKILHTSLDAETVLLSTLSSETIKTVFSLNPHPLPSLKVLLNLWKAKSCDPVWEHKGGRI